MRILLSNDDGYFAPGLAVLAEHLAPLGEITVVAPERDRSEPGLLGRDMPANDEREDYLRSSLVLTEAGWEATPFERQDSSMLGLLAQAQALAIRPVFAPAARKGDPCRFIRLR